MTDFSDPTILESPTGAAISLHHAAPSDTPQAIVQINHGLAEHAARYAPFAEFLNQHGFAVFAHDHRGHGRTKATDAPTGSFARASAGSGWQSVIDDTLAVNTYATTLYPDTPIITFGHSMGGMIAMNFALTYPDRQAGLAVWNANLNPGAAGRIAQLLLAAERMILGSDVPSRLLPKMTFEQWGKSIKDARTPFDWLSHDEEQVQTYIDDPDCGWDASVSLWQDVFAMGYRAGNRTELARLPVSLPIHLVGGGQDPATDGGKAVRWFAERLKQAGQSDVSIQVYETMRHETLNESAPPGSKGAMEDFLRWADRVLHRTD
ncbi:MAG: alpha/beta hydrolase [Alphaproteobacteria bacterium]|nr:alpha/beta hydrolase [Alphaproteobacteria bacterium]